MGDSSSQSRKEKLADIAATLRENLPHRKPIKGMSFGHWFTALLTDDEIEFLTDVDSEEGGTFIHDWLAGILSGAPNTHSER